MIKWCLNCKEQKQNCTFIGRLPCPMVHDPSGRQEIWVLLQTLLPSSSVTLENSEFQSLTPTWRSVFKRSLASNLLSFLQLWERKQEPLLWDHTRSVSHGWDHSLSLIAVNSWAVRTWHSIQTFLIHVHLLDLLLHTIPLWLIASVDFSPLNFSNFLKNFILEHVQWTLQFKTWPCKEQRFCLKIVTEENRVNLRTLSSHLTRKKWIIFFTIAPSLLHLWHRSFNHRTFQSPLFLLNKVFSWEEVLFLLLLVFPHFSTLFCWGFFQQGS